MTDIQPGSYWTHKREGYTAIVEPINGLLTKDPNDAGWHPAVAYKRDDNDSDIFARTVDDFLAKFRADMQDEGDAAA